MKTVEPLEREIQRQILQFLELHRIPCWRNNTGAMRANYKGRSLMIRFGMPGMPDVLGILPRPVPGVLLAIEAKRPSGKLSITQQETIDRLLDAGALAFVARSVGEVKMALRAEGVIE